MCRRVKENVGTNNMFYRSHCGMIRLALVFYFSSAQHKIVIVFVWLIRIGQCQQHDNGGFLIKKKKILETDEKIAGNRSAIVVNNRYNKCSFTD